MSPPEPAPAPPAHRRLTVIFKASSLCNGACTFCSVGTSEGEAVSEEDFERVAVEVERLVRLRRVEHLTFTFHGGEATLLGAPFLDRACSRIRSLAPHVQFNLQSNLLDVPDEIVEVILHHEIHLGSSVDPLFGERRDRSGHDAFPRWLANYRRLAERGVVVGSIFVVTRAALDRPADVYHAAQTLGCCGGDTFGLQVNPVYGQGRAAHDPDRLVEPRPLGRFLVDLFHLWERSGRSVRLTPHDGLLPFFHPASRTPPRLSCTYAGGCAESHVGIDHRLRVAGCGRRLDSGAYFGDLHHAHLDEILDAAQERRAVARRAEHLRAGACRDCRYWDVCHGGCPDDSSLAYGDVLRPSHWCEAYKLLFAAMEESFRRPARPRPPQPLHHDRLPHPPVAVHAALTPDEFPDTPPAPPGKHARWLLPAADPRALRFDSGLETKLDPATAELRLWAPTAFLRPLTMWEDLLRKPRVRVVLCEADGLDKALNLLDALGATVLLDVPAVAAQPGGPEAITRAVERFLFDPSWRAQVHPFSAILARRVHRHAAPLTNRWLLEPGCFHVTLPQDLASRSPQAAAAVEGLLDEQHCQPAEWLLARPDCLVCPQFILCGGQFADPHGRPCPPWLRALVDRIAAVGDELRNTTSPAPPEPPT